MSLAIQLPPREDQQEFNLRVWERLLADPDLAKMRFLTAGGTLERSGLCPGFPLEITI